MSDSSCKWLLWSVTQWMDQQDHQNSINWVSISQINRSLIHFSKQIAPNKPQGYRMKKVVSLILSLSNQWHHFYNVKYSVRFWCSFWWKTSFRIFIIASCWNINKTRNFPSSLESSPSRIMNSFFLRAGLVWKFLASYKRPIRGVGLMSGPLQVIVIRPSYLKGFICKGLICGILR